MAPNGFVDGDIIRNFRHDDDIGETGGTGKLAQLTCGHRHVWAIRTVVFGQQDVERGTKTKMLIGVIQHNHLCLRMLIEKVPHPLATVAIHGQGYVRKAQMRHKRLIPKHFRIPILWICL